MRVEQPGGGLRADSRDTRVAIRRITDQGEVVGNQCGLDAELLANADGVTDLPRLAIHLHDAVALHALGEVLVGCPDGDLVNARVGRREACSRREGVVGLDVDHGPDGHAHRGESVFEGMKLRPEGRLDSVTGLVPRPERIAERLNDVIGGYANVRRPGFVHLQHSIQDADNRPVLRIVPCAPSTQAIEVAVQLVSPIDEVYDHAGLYCLFTS